MVKNDSRALVYIIEGFPKEVTGRLQPKKEKCPALDRACGGAYQECAKNPEVRKIWVVLETNRI